ncbi:DarT ssDNA thymidine ADP-ribosyltransferase family protein [Plantibacter sp. YIM 135347]|uniref:DarT ssDNA thymidine ADP-ribosyltransferase family protein n=1 Tax=Plantibacter sp. YIM 135347 TaxID=3423919 RepID=UPI003D34C4A3
MSDECIHGFEGKLCASCFPKTSPAISTPAPVTTTTRRAPRSSLMGTTSLREPKAQTPPAVRAPVATKLPRVDVGKQRLYHVTHIRNLVGILESGRVFADRSDAWTDEPAVDISSDAQRERRRTTDVAGVPDTTVSHFVPFFLSPDASLWERVRSKEFDERLSAEATDSVVNDYVVLVTTVQAATASAQNDSTFGVTGVVVTDGDAAGALTRVASNQESAERMIQRLVSDDDTTALLAAEVLVLDSLPFDDVLVIGVGTVNVRETVKRMVADAGHRTKVAAYTPWFQPGTDED